MDQLPPELLSLIYTLVLPIPPCTSNFRIEYPSETRYEALTGLRLVSRRWNDIVVDTPELWSYLQLSQDRLNPPLNLERSKAAPLHVRIHFQMVKRDPSFADKLKRLWATTDRWKTYVGVAWVAFWGLRLLPARPLPTMEELWLIGLVGLAKITIDAPRLTTLVQNFDNVTPGATGFPNLKVWRTPFRAHRFEWDRFMMVVDACPHLERLELSNPHKGWVSMVSSRFAQAADHIVLPALRVLVMCEGTWTSDFPAYLRAPLLKEIQHPSYDDVGPFTVPDCSSCPSLSHIRFGILEDEVVTGTGRIQKRVSRLPAEVDRRFTVEIEHHLSRISAFPVLELSSPMVPAGPGETWEIKWRPLSGSSTSAL